MREVREIYGHFWGMGQGSVGGFGYSLQVLEYPADLRFDVAGNQLHSGWVKRDLPGEIHRVAHAHSLRVRADGLRSVRGTNNLSSHSSAFVTCHVRRANARRGY